MRRGAWRSWAFWRLPLTVVLTLAVAYAVAPVAAVVLAAAWFLYLAARFDNHTGSCLMLAVLALLVVAILAMLVGFLGRFGRY